MNLLWLFFRRRFWCKAAKLPKKKKSLQRYRALSDNYMENKMFISNNDRSKWPARWEFDGSSRRSGQTMSVDRLLFSALSLSMFWIKKPNKRSKCTMTSIPLSPWRCQEMNKTKSQTKRDILDFARTKDPQFQKKGLKVITLVNQSRTCQLCGEFFNKNTMSVETMIFQSFETAGVVLHVILNRLIVSKPFFSNDSYLHQLLQTPQHMWYHSMRSRNTQPILK